MIVKWQYIWYLNCEVKGVHVLHVEISRCVICLIWPLNFDEESLERMIVCEKFVNFGVETS